MRNKIAQNWMGAILTDPYGKEDDEGMISTCRINLMRMMYRICHANDLPIRGQAIDRPIRGQILEFVCGNADPLIRMLSRKKGVDDDDRSSSTTIAVILILSDEWEKEVKACVDD